MTTSSSVPGEYWEQRALRFATSGRGLGAVCSYGMPAFHNAAIDWSQRLALRPHLRVQAGEPVLDVGCGVGRWSVPLARQGACVTGVDVSTTMVAEARRRAVAAGVDRRCRFLTQAVGELDTGGRYSLIVVVTVLQHLMDDEALNTAVGRLASHLQPDGRLVALEAAPTHSHQRLDSPVFTARTTDDYLACFARHGLVTEALTGVDPAPWRRLVLPFYRRWPRAAALSAISLATALSVPVDLTLGRRWVSPSWHKVFVMRRSGDV